METRAHHVLIGLFTVLMVGAALLFGLWLGQSERRQPGGQYDIVFEEAVSGLSKGSTVEFNGIKVGEVAQLQLDPEDPRRVRARIQVDASAPMRTDTRARLVPAGITGLSLIRLSSGNAATSQPLQAHPDQPVPVIVATPSPMSKLLANGEDVVFNVNELLVQARAVLSDGNVQRIANTLQHLEQGSRALAGQRQQVELLLHNLTQASAQANTALLEATQALQSSQRLLEGPGAQTLVQAQRSLQALERTLGGVEQLVADNRAALQSGAHGLTQIGPALGELRGTLASLRVITRQLEDSPADYVLGAEPTREFQP